MKSLSHENILHFHGVAKDGVTGSILVLELSEIGSLYKVRRMFFSSKVNQKIEGSYFLSFLEALSLTNSLTHSLTPSHYFSKIANNTF